MSEVIMTILNRLPHRPDGLYSLDDIAVALGVKYEAVRRARERGDIPFEPTRLGRGRGGQMFFTKHQIEQALLAQCFPAPRPRKRLN